MPPDGGLVGRARSSADSPGSVTLCSQSGTTLIQSRQRAKIRIGSAGGRFMNLDPVPADTTREAWQVQMEVLRRMSPNRRLELAFQMTNSLREVVASGVRSRHPEYSDDQVRLAVIRLTL